MPLPTPIRLLSLLLFWLWLSAPALAIGEAKFPPLELTAEERAWLDQTPRIVLGISDQFQPDILVAEDGSRSGLVAEYFDLLNEQLGGRLQLHIERDWQAITEKARRGEIDGLASSAANKTWDEYFLYTRPYYYGYLHIYSRSDEPSAATLAAFAGKRVGYISGMRLVEKAVEVEPEIRLIGLGSQEELANALLEGQVDAVISIVDLEWWRRSNSILSFRSVGLIENSRHEVVMSIRKDWPLAPVIINKAMANIPATEHNRIRQTWLSGEVQQLRDLYLSDAEHGYVQSHRFSRAIAGGYPPLSFMDGNGVVSGIAEDYWELVRSRLQLEVVDQMPQPFSEILQSMQEGTTDLYVSTTRTAGREAYALFSDSYERYPIGLALQRGNGFVPDAAGLENYIVAVGRNHSAFHLLRERYPDVSFLEVADASAALEAVATGEAFAAAEALPVLQHLIAARADDTLHLGGVTDVYYDLQIMLSRQHESLLPLINRAIATITPQERLDIHKRWVWRDVVTEETVDYTLVWLVILGALAVIAVILLWNHQLSRQIRRRIEAERQEHEAGERLRSVMASLDDLVFVLDQQERIIDVYYRDERRLLMPPAEFLGKPCRDILPQELHAQLQDSLARLKENPGSVQQFEHPVDTPKGPRWSLNSITARLDSAGSFVGSTVVVTDISERKQTEIKLREAAVLFDLSNNGVILTDENKVIQRINPAFTEITGFSAEEVIGKTPSVFKSGHHPKDFYRHLWQTLLGEGVWEGEIWNRHKDGKIFPLWQRIVVIRDRAGNIRGYLSQFGDIARRKLTEEEIRHRGNYDALTGLANRSLFMERLDQAVRAHRRGDRKLAVLMIGLDRFRQVNETMGYPTGDELLKQCALRLRSLSEDGDTAARVGASEFGLLLTEQDGSVAVEERIRMMIADLGAAYRLPQGSFELSTSMGISLAPEDGDSAESLLSNAGLALTQAKQEGGVHRFFTESMRDERLAQHRLESALRRAVMAHELEVFYQPIVCLDTGQVKGVEALLRWHHHALGGVSPSQFIPVAESSGLIQPMGLWAVETVCRQLQAWQAAGLDLYASINVSACQIPDGLPPHHLRQVTESFGLAPATLVLEITESVIAGDLELVTGWLQAVRAHGFRVYLDDFGTGYSSLSYLKNFPVDAVKIDQSFVCDMESNHRDCALVETIVALSRTLNLAAVAEGIETAGQQAQLRAMNCPLGQGILFSHPLPPSLLEQWLRGNRTVDERQKPAGGDVLAAHSG